MWDTLSVVCAFYLFQFVLHIILSCHEQTHLATAKHALQEMKTPEI